MVPRDKTLNVEFSMYRFTSKEKTFVVFPVYTSFTKLYPRGKINTISGCGPAKKSYPRNGC